MDITYDPCLLDVLDGTHALIGLENSDSIHILFHCPVDISKVKDLETYRNMESSLPGGLSVIGLTRSADSQFTRSGLAAVVSSFGGYVLVEEGSSRLKVFGVVNGQLKPADASPCIKAFTHHILQLHVRLKASDIDLEPSVTKWFNESIRLEKEETLNISSLNVISHSGKVRLCDWDRHVNHKISVSREMSLVGFSSSIDDWKSRLTESLVRQIRADSNACNLFAIEPRPGMRILCAGDPSISISPVVTSGLGKCGLRGVYEPRSFVIPPFIIAFVAALLSILLGIVVSQLVR
jgi:hypothetical protein